MLVYGKIRKRIADPDGNRSKSESVLYFDIFLAEHIEFKHFKMMLKKNQMI